MNTNKESTCCFIGHRKIDATVELRNSVYELIEDLIVNKNVDTFLLGSRSAFNDLCEDLLCELKEKYPHIYRVCVRAEFPYIYEPLKEDMLKRYDDTYFPEKMIDAGNASYVERNYEMINKSAYCIIYYDENYLPPRRKKSKRTLFDYQPKSGTKIAYEYALKKCHTVINVKK